MQLSRGVEWAADLIPDLANVATEATDVPAILAEAGDLEPTLEEKETTP